MFIPTINQCIMCGKKSAFKRKLNNHTKNIHKDEKAEQCNSCDEDLKWKKKLNDHLENEHVACKAC